MTTPPGELRFFASRDVDLSNPDVNALRGLFLAMQAQFTRPEAGWNRAQFMRVIELARGCGELAALLPDEARANINKLRNRIEAIAEEKGVGA